MGCLYIVATPIGNKDDITLRALKILETVEIIAAEDTRQIRKLLGLHDIFRNGIISYNEHNEKKRIPYLIDKLKTGVSIALVSNAGTPCISDPGYRLTKEASENGIKIIPIPGVSAIIASLSAAGLPTDSFVFAGFLPKKKGKRIKQLNRLAKYPETIIFYESPYRILALLEEIIPIMGDRRGVLSREMTKLYEEFMRGALSEILTNLKNRPAIKGEITLLVMGCKSKHINKENEHE